MLDEAARLGRTVFRWFMSVLLMLLGLWMIFLGVSKWFDAEGVRQTTVTEATEETSQTVTVGEGSGTETQTTAESTAGSDAQNTAANTTVDKSTSTDGPETTTETIPVTKTITTLAPDTSPRSEGVTLALIGGGSVLLLAGATFGRISKITLPGGASLELIADTGDALAEVIEANEKQDAVDKKLAGKLAKVYGVVGDVTDATAHLVETNKKQEASARKLAAHLVALTKRVQTLESPPAPIK